MKTLINVLFLFIAFIFQGCVQAPSNARKTSASSSSTSSTGKSSSAASYPTFAADESLYWFTTTKITGTVTLNKNTQNIIYLRGKLVHDFLNSKSSTATNSEFFRKQYCMVANFSNASYKQVRIRAVPIFATTSTNATERLLRIDIPSATDNTSVCKFSTIDSTTAALAAFSLPEICPACTGQVTTTNLNLYETLSTSLTKIEATKLNLSTVLIKTDLTSNSADSSSSCTNSSCSAKGFDCCISGQCVKDASEKINASSNIQYNQAKTDYALNPLSFINYPNIFYICSNIAHTPVATSSSTDTPVSLAQARVAKYLTDYTCISDVSAGNGYLTCRNLDSSNVATAIDKTVSAYTAIKKKLSISCGCTASDDQMSIKCPDWGVLPVYPVNALKTNANITDFICYTPAPTTQIGPITNLNVNVSNRSAPHRFYSSAGLNIDDISGLKVSTPTTVQEGDDFYYLDEYNKIGAVNGSFNFNSILGKMTIDLSHTVPAKMVTVELGKSYILSATSGFFTPCSRCAKDSWFQTFSAHPTSTRGSGLQASGYTTSRDSYSSNTTFGNYEDTKFGRACYVPPTMLALAHQKNTSLQTQRLNRLKTQAAFYLNGYQRDWYGFNKGALIGSFDGVTWFAIGNGRRATATSTKLFLALNGSFLDLADKTDTIVNIIPDFSANTASDYDYDPELALTDPRQNTGATCQKFHQCSADADCVAQLGWEYTCADISLSKTKWPTFDSDAVELTNQERSGTLFEILQNSVSTLNGKRCIYRGAGAPCKRDYSILTDYNKKILSCAPNFYCASLTTNKFNEEIARSPNELSDMLYGMDSNVLGRPLNYVTANKSLESETISNIKYNATNAIGLSSGQSDDMGICRPGRSLSSVALTAHMNPDASKRSDYISQIGSCDSTATTPLSNNRFVTCPAFNDDLNFVETSSVDPTIIAETLLNQKTQNACGGEAKNSSSISAFASIEGLSLLNLQNITQPIMARDACFRRAGSVCHSDLDCGPNQMHEDYAGSVSINYFGGTDGEQNYWKESLICGQEKTPPAIGTTGYLDYQLSNNRCCREIGKDFSMITQGPASIVPENAGTNINLLAAQFSYLEPTKTGRYSRYSISKTAQNDSTTIPLVAAAAEPKSNQWKVINETGSLTCCGGGWIRKFADGTHDWKIKNRLSLDTNNFSCLNFRSPLADSSYVPATAGDSVFPLSFQREYEYLCKNPGEGGCLQIPFQDSNNFTILSPLAYNPSTKVAADSAAAAPASGYSRVDTSPTADPIDGTSPWTQLTNSDAPYSPTPFSYSPLPLDIDITTGKSYNFFTDKTTDFGVQFYLPAYIGWDGTISNPGFIGKVSIKYYYSPPHIPLIEESIITGNVGNAAECLKVINYDGSGAFATPIEEISTLSTWCISSSTKTQNRPVFMVRAETVARNWKYAGVIIDFLPTEVKKATKISEPGNALYYLSKLAHLELIGIPQITYEPLYCNNNQEKLVPGIFKSAYSTRTLFEAASNKFTSIDPIESYNEDNSASTTEAAGYGNKDSGSDSHYVFQDKLDHTAVFSSKDFTCCTPLGKNPTSASKCCTGYAVNSSDGKTSTCKIPKGTDLNVYFNKFVSSEGVGEDQPGGGLIIKASTGASSDAEVDFNPYTGEPKFRGSTYDKLVALGQAYCDGATVVTGGAFGAFPPEPFSGTYALAAGVTGNIEDSFPLSIVDSVLDFQTNDPNLGKFPFDSGFKWNHHYYCK